MALGVAARLGARVAGIVNADAMQLLIAAWTSGRRSCPSASAVASASSTCLDVTETATVALTSDLRRHRAIAARGAVPVVVVMLYVNPARRLVVSLADPAEYARDAGGGVWRVGVDRLRISPPRPGCSRGNPTPTDARRTVQGARGVVELTRHLPRPRHASVRRGGDTVITSGWTVRQRFSTKRPSHRPDVLIRAWLKRILLCSAMVCARVCVTRARLRAGNTLDAGAGADMMRAARRRATWAPRRYVRRQRSGPPGCTGSTPVAHRTDGRRRRAVMAA